MKKSGHRLMSWALALMMVFGVFAVSFSVTASAVSEDERITQQINDASAWAHNQYGGSFYGMCGAYVRYNLAALDIIDLNSDWDCSGNGNKFVGNINTGTTSKGYTKTKYSGNNCLSQIINANGGGNVYNIVVSWTHQSSYQSDYSDSNPGAGHVTFIHAILNGYVYFSESYSFSGKTEGSPLVYSLSDFMSKWNGYYGNALGAAHFISNLPIDPYVPVIQSAYVDNVTPFGFRLYAIVSDNNGVSKVDFETWKDGSPDRKTYSAKSMGNDIYYYDVDISDLTNEAGVYHSIVHAYDSSNNHSTSEIYIIVPDKDIYVPVIQSAYVDNINAIGFRLYAVVSDNIGVSKVEFETWKDGSPDRKTYSAKSMGNDIYYYDVAISDLTNESGVYHSIVHAYDSSSNYSDSEIYIIVPEHTYELVNEENATCTANGKKVYKCIKCKDTYTETIYASGHDYTETVVEPTATSQGYTLHTCTKCGDSYKDNFTEFAAPLTNTSTLNSDKLSQNSRVWITRGAEGGDGNYSYKYYYKRATARLWTAVPEGLINESGASVTLRALGDYEIKVIVKDGSGETAELIKTVTVVDGKSTAFVNNSYVNKLEAKPNTKIVLTGAAAGSEGYKYAFYYKRSTAGVWSRPGTEFGEGTSVNFTPRSEGTYLVKIDIMDKDGELVSKNYTVTISNDAADAPVNNSTVSASEITAGTRLTATGAASGGAGGYSYTFEYRKSTANKWNAMSSSGDTASIKLSNAGIYDIRVTVTDSAGASSERIISVIVK